MGKRNRKANRAKYTAGEDTQGGAGGREKADPVRVLIACRPGEHAREAAVALHSSIRFVACAEDNTENTENKISIGLVHALDVRSPEGPANVIRALKFSPTGRYLAVGGDDKALYVYDVDSAWELRCRIVSPKKLSCVTWVSQTVVLAANKYGDVFAVDVGEGKECVPRDVMGHFCSIVLSLSVGWIGGGLSLASTDRDGKVRVTAIEDVEKLSLEHHNNEIRSFCLGHRSYVSGGMFIDAVVEGQDATLLVTGGGDGFRLWNPVDGTELCAVQDPTVWNVLELADEGKWAGKDQTGQHEEEARRLVAVFDGEHGHQLGVGVVDRIDEEARHTADLGGSNAAKRSEGAGWGLRMRLRDVPGMKRLSSVSLDGMDRSVAWVVGARNDGSVGLQLVKISERDVDDQSRPMETVETTVAAEVLSGLPDWTDNPKSFFASYYTMNKD